MQRKKEEKYLNILDTYAFNISKIENKRNKVSLEMKIEKVYKQYCPVYSKELAKHLTKCGFCWEEIKQNKKDSDKFVFFYVATEELLEEISEYTVKQRNEKNEQTRNAEILVGISTRNQTEGQHL